MILGLLGINIACRFITIFLENVIDILLENNLKKIIMVAISVVLEGKVF